MVEELNKITFDNTDVLVSLDITALFTKLLFYHGTIYAQVKGAAMSSPVSLIVAHLLKEWFEKAMTTVYYEISFWTKKIC